MDIPVYHNYTLARAWEKAKMLQQQSSQPGFLGRRARCLKRMCKYFYDEKFEVWQQADTVLTGILTNSPRSSSMNTIPRRTQKMFFVGRRLKQQSRLQSMLRQAKLALRSGHT